MVENMKHSQELTLSLLTPDNFSLTCQLIDQGIQEQVAPGMVAGYWRLQDPDRIHVYASGAKRQVPSVQPMSVDTAFDLASLTKIMATAALTAVLVDRRWLNWDTRLQAILPEFCSPEITLGHLLSHTAGFVAWRPLWENIRSQFLPHELHAVSVEKRQQAMRELVLEIAPEVEPGQRCLYSDISFLLLGFALEKITQMPLDRAVQEHVWNSWGLDTAFFRRVTQYVQQAPLDHVAATENCPWRGGVLQGQVHDDNCWAMGGYAGHAGAFGTIRDVLHFARGLLNGEWISRSTLQQSWVSTSLGRTWGGWDTVSLTGSSTGQYFSNRSVGHLGFTGTSLWIDPDAELAVALLTNRVHPSRENNKIREFRPLFHDAIRKDLEARA